MSKLIHSQIADTAKALAAEAYEELAKVNEWYQHNKSVDIYVRRNWQHYIPFAREALIAILSKDYSFEIAMGVHTEETVQRMKDQVAEALIIDGQYKANEAPASELVH